MAQKINDTQIQGKWKDWTPTLSVSAGSVSNISIDEARYVVIGDTVAYSLRVTFTSSATAIARITPPVPPRTNQAIGVGFGIMSQGGTSLLAQVYYSGGLFQIRNGDGSGFAAGSNRNFGVSGVYERAAG